MAEGQWWSLRVEGIGPVEANAPNSFPIRDGMSAPDSETLPVAGQQEQAIAVHRGLQVYSQDGQLLGQVEEFIIDAAGNLTSFVVTTGSSLGHDLRVMMEWIQTVTRERIQLCITAAEVRLTGSASNPVAPRRRSRRSRRGGALK